MSSGLDIILIYYSHKSCHKLMRKWRHLNYFCFCDFCYAIIVGLNAQLDHPSIKTTILLVKLTCKYKMPAEFGQRAIMSLGSNAS